MSGVSPGVTVKIGLFVLVRPLTVTATGPVVASAGTVARSAVALASSTVAAAPLKATESLAIAASKLVPRINTSAPAGPRAGDRLVTTTGLLGTVNTWDDTAVRPLTVTLIGPVVAAAGTVTVSAVALAFVTAAAAPLNVTALFAGAGSKFAPAIVTDAPGA